MLRRAQHKAATMGRDLELVQSDGASLPFRDETFDHVLNMGGLQFYGDPFQGVAEMARVLKPGGRVTIIDQALPARNMLRRMPAHMEYAGTVAEAVVNMVRLVPFTMTDYDSDWLPGGEFFKLEFSRPAVAGD
jgi:ubiquinone/menaquinone biosynthesis C-methylase UbiE